MNILCIGDIVGGVGLSALESALPEIKYECAADFTVVNGENSADNGRGLNKKGLRRILDAGADVVTTGNHAFAQAGYETLFDDEPSLLRPANIQSGVAGRGFSVTDTGALRILTVNLSGQSFMGISYQSPYDEFERILRDNPHDVVVVDFHAESTGEKQAFARCFDGRISAFFGTHTHVETADETVLPLGTGYITDIGMTGPVNSVIGTKTECSIKKQRFGVPVRFEVAGGPVKLCGAVFDVDESSAVCRSVRRITKLV